MVRFQLYGLRRRPLIRFEVYNCGIVAEKVAGVHMKAGKLIHHRLVGAVVVSFKNEHIAGYRVGLPCEEIVILKLCLAVSRVSL